MMRHRMGWQDDGMIAVTWCGATVIYLVLTAPDGPMGGPEGDDYYAQVCPSCGARLIARWGARIETLTPTPGASPEERTDG